MMLSCKKATLLINKKEESPLSWTENIQLVLHTSMCDGCKAFEKQSQIINKILSNYITDFNKSPLPIIENQALKNKILQKLK